MKNKIVSASLAVNLMAGATVAGAAAPEILDARASDPIRLGWMVGSPPPPERVIRYERRRSVPGRETGKAFRALMQTDHVRFRPKADTCLPHEPVTMPFEPSHFAHKRPYLFHLTAATNLWSIADSQELVDAATILGRSVLNGKVRQRRTSHEIVGSVHIRDQAPLRRRCMILTDGWSFEDFVEHLNMHVFF